MKQMMFLVAALGMVSSAAAAAPTLEVLGVHAGDELSSAKKTLEAKGFKQGGGGLGNCNETYELRMKGWVKRGKMDVLLGDIMCSERYAKGASRVLLTNLMSPHGYVLKSIEYSDKSTETMGQLERRLTEKFGIPDKRTGFAEWSMPAGAGMPAQLHNYGGDYSPSLKLEAQAVMSDTFLGEIRKDLRSRAVKSKTEL